MPSETELKKRSGKPTSVASDSESTRQYLLQKQLKKPARTRRVNEEDEFNIAKLIKAIILTVIAVGATVAVSYHAYFVAKKSWSFEYKNIIEFIAYGICGVVISATVSLKAVKLLNQYMFINQHPVDKKYI